MRKRPADYRKKLRQRIAERGEKLRKLDLSVLSQEDREAVERALKQRNLVVFSRRFAAEDVLLWEQAAKQSGISVREWVESRLRAVAVTELK